MSRPHCSNNVVYGCGVPNMSNIGKFLCFINCAENTMIKQNDKNKA